MKANGSPPPIFETNDSRRTCLVRLPAHPLALLSTLQVTPEVQSILKLLVEEQSRQQLQQALGLKDDEHFRKAYLLRAIDAGFVQMTLPDKPRSSNQRYRLTGAGRLWLKKHGAD